MGLDASRKPRRVEGDGHISNDWFRTAIWAKALAAADLGFHVTPHGLRHAHASWLLAGGADLQVVKERLGHGSIRTTERYLHSLPSKADVALTALAATRGTGSVSPMHASLMVHPSDAAEVRAAMARIKDFYDKLGVDG